VKNETTTITLPSGRIASIRKPTVRDLLQAHRVVDFSSEPMAIAMGLVAQVALIDEKPLVFEEVLELSAEDGLVLQSAVLEDEQSGNFTEAQGGQGLAFPAPQQ